MHDDIADYGVARTVAQAVSHFKGRTVRGTQLRRLGPLKDPEEAAKSKTVQPTDVLCAVHSYDPLEVKVKYS